MFRLSQIWYHTIKQFFYTPTCSYCVLLGEPVYQGNCELCDEIEYTPIEKDAIMKPDTMRWIVEHGKTAVNIFLTDQCGRDYANLELSKDQLEGMLRCVMSYQDVMDYNDVNEDVRALSDRMEAWGKSPQVSAVSPSCSRDCESAAIILKRMYQ